MNTRAIELLAGDRERWPLAGDQLYVDFDLSEEALPAGTRLAVGARQDQDGSDQRGAAGALQALRAPSGRVELISWPRLASARAREIRSPGARSKCVTLPVTSSGS